MRTIVDFGGMAGALAFASAAFNAKAERQAAYHARQLTPLRAPTADDIVHSRNGGRNGKHMAAVRAARKARNVKRHRAHMKGK